MAVRLHGVVRHLAKQHTHTLTVVRPSDGLGEDVADINLLNLAALELVARLRQCVGHDERLETALGDAFERRLGQNTVRHNGTYSCCTTLLQALRSQIKCATRVSHIVDQDRHLVLRITHEDHTRHLIRLLALLVEERKVHTQLICDRRSALRATGVGRHNHHAVDIEHLAHVLQRGRLRVQVIDRHVEKALDLRCVQVHRNHMVTPSCLEHIGDQTSRDRRTTLVFLVLPCVEKVRDHGRHTARAGRLARIDHDKQLHE